MIQAIIKRVFLSKDVTFGVLALDDDAPICVTLERPWLNNAPNVSCIPAGQYTCKRVNSPKFGNVFEVTGVTGRSKVLIHWGNWVTDTEGCIVLGESYAILKNEVAVAQSKAAFDEFMAKLAAVDSFQLTIKEV